jgi:isopentenyl phosphate kinase
LRRSNIRVRRLLWCGETDGLYDTEGNTIDVIAATNYTHARAQIGRTAGTDVTGGMLLRLRTTRALAKKGVESWLINGKTPGLLEAALRGETVPGTRVVVPGTRVVG